MVGLVGSTERRVDILYSNVWNHSRGHVSIVLHISHAHSYLGRVKVSLKIELKVKVSRACTLKGLSDPN
jgi:hypothetical protein